MLYLFRVCLCADARFSPARRGVVRLGQSVQGEIKMACFDSSSGWLHLVFGNEYDFYDRPSLARITDRDRYLYFCLKRAGYRSVFFLGAGGKSFLVQEDDEVSAAALEKLLEQKTGKKWSLFSSEAPSKDEVFLQRLKNALTGQKNAVVASAKDFQEFFQGEAAKRQLEDLANKVGSGSGRGILVLTFPTDLRKCSELLTADNSVLRQISGGVRAASRRSVETGLFDALKNEMGGCCVFLNDLSRERIGNTVQHLVVMEPERLPLERETLEYTEQLTELIFRLCHSRSLRDAFSCAIDPNPTGEMSKIDSLLRSGEFCREAEKWIGGQADPVAFAGRLAREYPLDEDSDRCLIFDPGDAILPAWDQMHTEAEGVERKKIWRVRDALGSILSRCDEKLHTEEPDQIEECTRSVRKSVKALAEKKDAVNRAAARKELNDKLDVIEGWIRHYYDDENGPTEPRAWYVCHYTLAWIDELGEIEEKQSELQEALQPLYGELEKQKAKNDSDGSFDTAAAERFLQLRAEISSREAMLAALTNLGTKLRKGIDTGWKIALRGQYSDNEDGAFAWHAEQITSARQNGETRTER